MFLAELVFHHLRFGCDLSFLKITTLRADANPVSVNVEGSLPRSAPSPFVELEITVIQNHSLWAEHRHSKHSVKPSVFCPLIASASTAKVCDGNEGTVARCYVRPTRLIASNSGTSPSLTRRFGLHGNIWNSSYRWAGVVNNATINLRAWLDRERVIIDFTLNMRSFQDNQLLRRD